ncbi:hypothetical protein AAGG52_08765 [Bacillus licheniformis]
MAAAKCSSDSYRLTAPPLSEPLALMKQIKQNGLSGFFTKKRAAAYIQFDEEGQQRLWSARRMISRTIADNLCLLAYQQIAKGPLSLTVLLFAKKRKQMRQMSKPFVFQKTKRFPLPRFTASVPKYIPAKRLRADFHRM